MRKKISTIVSVMLILLLSTVLVQCSNKDKDEQSEKSTVSEDTSIDSEEQRVGEMPGQDSSMIVVNAFMSIETLEFEKSVKDLNEMVKKYGGFIENSNIGRNNYIEQEVFKSGSFRIRIPQSEEDKFAEESANIGNTISQSTSKSDITKAYTDTESKLKVLKVKEERILDILEKAVEIEDIIKLEDKLNEVIYEKELLTNQVKDMDDQVAYSTFDISLLEVKRYSNSEAPDAGFWEKITSALGNSIYVFRFAIEKLIVAIIYMLPFFVLAGLVYLVVRKLGKRG